MFKSKLFQYCAIATTVVVTSSVIVSSTASLQSQSQAKLQPQAKVETQMQLASPDKFAELPDSVDKLAERTNSPDLPSGKILKQLNLSLEQLQKLKAVRDRDLGRIRELAQQSRQANKELRDLLAGTEGSDVIRAKHTQVLNLQQELQKQHFERMLAMREILTPQQRSQLNEIMQKNRPNRIRDGLKDRMKDRMKQRIDKLNDLTNL